MTSKAGLLQSSSIVNVERVGNAGAALGQQELPSRCGTPHRPPRGWNDRFRRLAHRTSCEAGHPWAFTVALGTIVVWGATGPLFHFSDTWQLVINTGTTIVTFLMVFLIQNTQNRDSHEIHLKLDELIRANKRARNRIIGVSDLTDDELDELQVDFQRLAQEKIARRSQPPSTR
jgi:low affinity Fe/Cu permease